MKTILAPTDFSANALVATKYAIELARKTGQKVKLVHSYIKLYTGYDGDMGSEKLIAQAQTESQDQMTALVLELRQDYPDVEVTGESIGGYASDAIIKKIHDDSYSLVVMGSKGATNAADKLLGSTTYDVLSKSPIPLLAVPQNAPDFSLNTIGFFSAYQDSDITALLRLRHTLGNEINVHILHLYTSSREPIEHAQKWEHKIKTEFPKENISFRTARVTGINAAAVTDIAKHEQLDLLVLTRVHKSFLTKLISKSLTKDIANNLNIPTLFING